jgi:hypothetical protein
MSLLFEQKESYLVQEKFPQVWSSVNSIKENQITALARNFVGEITNNTFVFKPKLFWQPGLFGFPNTFCSLKGTLQESGTETRIDIVVSPSIGTVVIYYLVLIFLIQATLKADVPIEKNGIAAIGGTFAIVVFLWFNIHVAVRRITKRFEKLLNIQ